MVSRGSLQKSIQGFTLVELLVTITLVAVIAAYAAPSISHSLANRRIKIAATELQSSILQARSLAATTSRAVEMWPAYSTSWNVASSSRGSAINLPNSQDVSKSNLINSKLSWYVVTAGAATGTSALAIADSTTNNYPIRVSLDDRTVITTTTSPLTASPSASSGIRFFTAGTIGNIAATSTQFTQVTFKVCDSADSSASGYTIIVNPFGGVRSLTGAVCL